MAIEWEQASKQIVDLVSDTIVRHHHHLRESRIGVLFRSQAAKSAGREIIGKASPVTAKWRAVLGPTAPLDFIIWFAEDWWSSAALAQKEALVDHELCHCTWSDTGLAIMRGHDIEEFTEIIERHGIWKPDIKPIAEAFAQAPLIEISSSMRPGEVIALTPPVDEGAGCGRILSRQ